MAVVLVVLSVLVLLGLEVFVFQPRRHPAPVRRIPLPGLEPLSRAHEHVPRGVFLQPTFTWTRIGEDGDVFIGVHPMLLGLIGAPYEVELRPADAELTTGDPLITLGDGAHHVTLPSPVAGRIAGVNRAVTGETDWRGLGDGDGAWLYRVRPTDVAREVGTWMLADDAVEWTRRQYERVREYFATGPGLAQLGVTMADGGEVPLGILGALDEVGWESFQDTFLNA